MKLAKISSSPALDTEVLLSHILHKDKTYLYTNPTKKLTQIQSSKFKKLIRKRARHWPVAYLVGHKEFCGLDFIVTPQVLIPRPETELLVELAFKKICNLKSEIKNVVDIGTGSGNIIISLAKKLAEYNRLVYYTTQFYAVDPSATALRIARRNARRHRVASKIKFLQGNLLSPFLKSEIPALSKVEGSNLKSAIVIANLPYLTKKQLDNITIKHEPKEALYGGKDGLKYFRELFRFLSKFKIRNSIFLFEHDPRQKILLKKLVKKYFPQAKTIFHRDLASQFRVMEISIKNTKPERASAVPATDGATNG